MARPKKQKPTHSSGMYRFLATVGHKFDGTPIRKAFYSSKSVAHAKLKAEEYKVNQAVAEQTGQPFVENENIGFSAVADKWLELMESQVSSKTYETYERSVRLHLKPYFGTGALNNIKPKDIQLFLNKKSTELPQESVKKYKQCLFAIFSFAEQNDYCIKNPCNGIKIPENDKKTEKRIYTQEQTNLIINYAKTHKLGLPIWILLDYGLSRGELLGLSWEDFDYNNKMLYIRKSATDIKDEGTGKYTVKLNPPKNKYRKREIPISQETADYINNIPRELIIGKKKNLVTAETIFCNSIGGIFSPSNWVKRQYNVFMSDMQEHYAEQGITIPRLSPHELRHTRASLWVNSGINIFAVANMLGHGDLKMLRKRYAHSDVESTRKLMGIE